MLKITNEYYCYFLCVSSSNGVRRGRILLTRFLSINQSHLISKPYHVVVLAPVSVVPLFLLKCSGCPVMLDWYLHGNGNRVRGTQSICHQLSLVCSPCIRTRPCYREKYKSHRNFSAILRQEICQSACSQRWGRWTRHWDSGFLCFWWWTVIKQQVMTYVNVSEAI